VDALRDLDDPLCLINLFATLQHHKGLSVENKNVEVCQKLAREFNLYVVLSKSLRKAFFSIKGVYFQAEIMGQAITWIQPYQFIQKLPADVDYKVMQTFLDFYLTLLRFTNLKLFRSLNLQYPLLVDEKHEKDTYLSLSALITKQIE